MSRTLFGIVGLISAATTVAVAAPRLAVGALACLGVTGLIWLCSRCRHSGPLGLLPPLAHPDGTHEPARWFCSSCGKEWPAGFDHERTPIVKYAGYDESKAPAAAKRASLLAKRTQNLAVRRAGLAAGRSRSSRPAAVAAVSTTPAGPSTVVSIQSIRGRRAAAK